MKLHRPWTEDEDKILKDGINQCLSATQISGLLVDRTRNAVIGRAHRFKISIKGFTRPPGKKGPRIAQLKTGHRISFARPPEPKGKIDPIHQGPAFNADAEPDSAPISFDALMESKDKCKWPLGEMFCGCSTPPRKPYCAKHSNTSKQQAPTGKPYKSTPTPFYR